MPIDTVTEACSFMTHRYTHKDTVAIKEEGQE